VCLCRQRVRLNTTGKSSALAVKARVVRAGGSIEVSWLGHGRWRGAGLDPPDGGRTRRDGRIGQRLPGKPALVADVTRSVVAKPVLGGPLARRLRWKAMAPWCYHEAPLRCVPPTEAS
jgi:hypothetical protein